MLSAVSRFSCPASLARYVNGTQTPLFRSMTSKVQIWSLMLLQGVGFGIGGGMLYMPIINLLSEWFVQRRGLAGGIIFAGSGVGGQSDTSHFHFELNFNHVCHIFRICISSHRKLPSRKSRVPLDLEDLGYRHRCACRISSPRNQPPSPCSQVPPWADPP